MRLRSRMRDLLELDVPLQSAIGDMRLSAYMAPFPTCYGTPETQSILIRIGESQNIWSIHAAHINKALLPPCG